ncbi:DUF885 family protein [Halorubrum ezzemoulense]|uniref:DUF885 domain-containing protein n=1 Tax=Halorubrum ezzemoulense TaxID=337243 RepID=A0A256K4G0_HALEZ|nr:DUF885 family protein [Halorubrum ezzemoulense]OYR75910.1 hypothetical protein DJ76_00675 [Halorubrum ezzemoulense]
MNTAADLETFEEWLDAFFASYYKRRPVNATFIGVHDYDDELPDFSTEGVASAVDEIDRLRAELDRFPTEDLTERQQLDRKLAAGALDIQRWEYEGTHFHQSNPCIYTGEAVFGVASLFLTKFAPLSERVDSAISRMEAIPGFLSEAQETLGPVPEHWLWRANDEVSAALALFGDGLGMLAETKNIDDPAFAAAASEAYDAFKRFGKFLDSVETTTVHAAGEEALSLVLERGHFREESPDEILALGEKHLARSNEELEAGLDDFPEDNVDEALAALADDHPSAEEYYERHTECWEKCRDISDGRFIDWPEYPLEYVPRPEWVREAAQDLYFLFYRAPAPHDDVEPVEYLLEPVEPTMDEERRERRLRRWNTSQIKLNHVAHHGGLGHHVQNHRAYNVADSRIGQMAAVDTPYRIALCCGGTMAEGWSPYASELLRETDFLTDREAYSLHATRRRMAARAVVDVKLHRNEFTADEAIAYYQDVAGMDEGGARYEVVKNSMFPGMAAMYLLGLLDVWEIRRELEAELGAAFNLQEFHESLLSSGSVPLTLKQAQLRESYVN